MKRVHPAEARMERELAQENWADPPHGHAAVLSNPLSPSPFFFWSMVGGPILLRGWREAPASGIGFIPGFYLPLIPTLAVIVLAFGIAGPGGGRSCSRVWQLILLW